MKYRDGNLVLYSRCTGSGEISIPTRHLLPSIASETAVLATPDIGWVALNIFTLSFLGLGVQVPTPEWGVALNETKSVMTTDSAQMIVPGAVIMVMVAVFNLLGDASRDTLGPKGASSRWSRCYQ